MIVTNLAKHPLFLGKRAVLPIGTSEISRGVASDCEKQIMHWVIRGYLRVEDTTSPKKEAPKKAAPKKAARKTKRATKKKTTKRSSSTEG